MYPKADIKLTSSASDQNTFLTYVCLINEIKPTSFNSDKEHTKDSNCDEENPDDKHIRVERCKALHELVDEHANDFGQSYLLTRTEQIPNTPSEVSELPKEDETKNLNINNTKILRLTKMKWLTENREDCPDSSSASISPSSSTSSINSNESESDLDNPSNLDDKYLSTILQLDKEHNLFGLSNVAIVGSRASKKIHKDDGKAVFHQNAIVQICCASGCCKHKSKTDLPASLKCAGCRGCCVDPCCPVCLGPPCNDPPICPPLCSSCPRGSNCKVGCPPLKCMLDCTTCYGLRISLKRKPKYEPPPVELTPRSSCILQKPMAARTCTHQPQCISPSSAFPYLMPCYWPARAAAPCTTPGRCFHNPPCRAPRRPRVKIPPEEQCPKGGKCEGDAKKTTCPNPVCPGKNPAMKKEIETRFGKK